LFTTFYVSRFTFHEAAMTIPISYYLILSAIVFLTGVVGVLIRRNIIAILLSVELMLNATNINFVAFSEHLQDLGGQVFVFFALTVAAAEVAVGLAIIIALQRAKDSINIEEFNLMKW
jgi:NADH-quinone oxidoreductase subunit K